MKIKYHHSKGYQAETEEFGVVVIYAVGVLEAVKYDIRSILGRSGKYRKYSRTKSQVEYLRYQFRRRNFRAIKSAFNGYLAEPIKYLPISRCGSGWTKKRALRSLYKHAQRGGFLQ